MTAPGRWHEIAPEIRRLAAAARAEAEQPGWPFGGKGEDNWQEHLTEVLPGEVGAFCAALTPSLIESLLDHAAPAPDTTDPAGTWIVTGVSALDDHSAAAVYSDELTALRAANRDETLRAYFLPCGKPLNEVVAHFHRTERR